ncbi:hypothetical protein X793_02425 [Dehalococcoides mccartyi CG4]|nr:hypothetical protein X793_02425 [Dehalococcoides mccartyi CG4]
MKGSPCPKRQGFFICVYRIMQNKRVFHRPSAWQMALYSPFYAKI